MSDRVVIGVTISSKELYVKFSKGKTELVENIDEATKMDKEKALSIQQDIFSFIIE